MLVNIPEGCKSYGFRKTAETAIKNAKLPGDIAVIIHAQSVPSKKDPRFNELRFFPVLLPSENQVQDCISLIHSGVGFHVFRR